MYNFLGCTVRFSSAQDELQKQHILILHSDSLTFPLPATLPLNVLFSNQLFLDLLIEIP